jgi:hypothetical protein
MSNIANRVFTCLLSRLVVSRLVVHRVLHEGTKVLDTGSVLAMIGGYADKNIAMLLGLMLNRLMGRNTAVPTESAGLNRFLPTFSAAANDWAVD